MTRRAHAKVNLGLAVLARRGDGFHEVETLMARLDLADEVDVTLSDGPSGRVRLSLTPAPPPGAPVWFTASLAGLPTGDDNLSVRAASAYLRAWELATGETAPAVEVALVKRVPVAAGLGGGSSDAAAVLAALEGELPANLELGDLAGRLGSDVPFFLAGWPAAVARGRGERLTQAAVPNLALVLAKPATTISAANAYAGLAGFTPRLKHEAALAALVAGDEPRWRNGLQTGVVRDHPEVREVLNALRDLGLKGVLMSGSGPTCFGVAPDAEAATALAARLREERPELWVQAATIG